MASKSRIPSSSKASSLFSSTDSLTSDTASSVDVKHSQIGSSIPKAPLSLKLSTDSVDDFALNEKVWVNGSRPGVIRFIGETKFALGKWIGVQLTSPNGKNDGSVSGVRYFTCPDSCGVFVKPQRLTKAPMPDSVFQKRLTSPARETISSNISTDTSSETASDIQADCLLKNSPFLMQSNTSNGGRVRSFQINDRVLVNASSGTKLGTLMFLGETDFAAGQWAGIELDDPVGKNDGSVAGKRYFNCKMKYGLFAPLHKITAAPLSALSKTSTTGKKSGLSSKTSSVTRLASNSRLSRAGSQESVSSVASSVASTATGRLSRTGIRLGVTSLKSPTNGSSVKNNSSSHKSPLVATVAGTNAAILDALKEKDEHITQLLKERDLERGEFSRVAMQADELEEKVASLQAENARIATEADEEISELKRLNSEYEEIQLKLSTKLEEDRSKLEDIQFRLEEETLAKAELETMVESLRKDLNDFQCKSTTQSSLSSKIEDSNLWKEKFHLVEKQLQSKDNELFKLREDITRKDEQLFQFEASMEKRNTEFNSLQCRVRELEHELESSVQRSNRLMETIDSLNQRLSSAEHESNSFKTERVNLIEEIKEYENKIFALEEKLIEEVNQVKENSDQLSSQRIAKLEAELVKKNAAEHTLEEKLMETKARYEKFEAEVNSLADQLRDLRKIHEEECKKRKSAEEKVSQLAATNTTLQSKVDELLHFSGSNSEMLAKINEELTLKQKEFKRKEEDLHQEIETLHRQTEAKEIEIRNYKVDIENLKSALSRFEKREQDVEKLIQANENELKLARSDCEEKQRAIDDLKIQLIDVNKNIVSLNEAQLKVKEKYESQLSCSNSGYNELKQQVDTLTTELGKYKKLCFEIEAERDRHERDCERSQRIVQEREKLLEKVNLDLLNVKEQFEDYRRKADSELDCAKQTNHNMDHLAVELERNRNKIQEINSENQFLQQENHNLSAKVEELKEDIEATKRHHQEELNELEFKCQQQEQLALSRSEELQELGLKQNDSLREFRQLAEAEKHFMEQKLDELEVKLKEQQQLLAAEQERQQRRSRNLSGCSGLSESLNYEQQIDFLNSIIVDMQKKNDELSNRVQVLEEIGLGEFEHSFQSQVETTQRANRHTNGHIRTLRKYCDICEIFDAHDTEDCPQQSSSSLTNGAQEPGHTYNIIARDEVRLYCTGCERFGHQLDNCPVENETF